MKIKCTKIKYDLEGETSAPKLPKTLTVEVNSDMLDCCVESTEGDTVIPDMDEADEMVAEAIEEKTGYPVTSFRAERI